MKNADFHDRLIEAMKIRSVSAADLCRLTGIDKSALSRYRSGAYKPNQLNTYLLAQALRVNPAWLMGFDVPMSSDDDLPQLLDSPGFLEQVVQLVLDGTDEDVADQQAALDQRLAELDDARRKHDNLLRAIEEGIITPGVRSRLSELEDLLDSLRADVDALRLEMHPITREDVEFSFSEMRRHRDMLDWQALVDVFINRVYYYPDHLLILFNFGGDGSRVQIDFGSSNNDDQSQPLLSLSNYLWLGCAAISARI